MTGANETMQASMEAHFGDALAAMRQPFVIYDNDERLMAYNAAFADLHRDADGTCILQSGLTFQALTEWRLRTGFFRPATLPDTAAPDIVADHYQAKGEVIYQLRDGRWILVERHALPGGRNIGLWIDITALKRVEAQLRETALDLQRSQEQLSRAQRIAHIGSDERDLATGHVTWSDETYRIFGGSRETFAPARENLLALVHPDERAAVAAALEKGTVDYAPARDEFRIIRPDGAQRIIVRHSEVVFDAEGRALRRIGTIQDVTDTRIQEKLEHDLQRAVLVAKEQAEAANAALEQRVEERSRELKAAQDELLKKERLSVIGQITATVAHELRNPLSAIKNTVFALKEAHGAAGASLARPLARMERSVDRCNEIIGELLDYSRLRELKCETRAVDDWLGELLDEQAVPGNITLTRELQTDPALANFDPDRFRRVIINLVENSAQAFTEQAGARIVLSTRVIDGSIAIAIEDNGPGIPPETLARVFEPLFSTKSFGTGLGLPVVKQIVEQHGGTIELSSTVGVGTRALVSIPLHRNEAAA